VENVQNATHYRANAREWLVNATIEIANAQVANVHAHQKVAIVNAEKCAVNNSIVFFWRSYDKK